jgi:hypothetical protein
MKPTLRPHRPEKERRCLADGCAHASKARAAPGRRTADPPHDPSFDWNAESEEARRRTNHSSMMQEEPVPQPRVLLPRGPYDEIAEVWLVGAAS